MEFCIGVMAVLNIRRASPCDTSRRFTNASNVVSSDLNILIVLSFRTCSQWWTHIFSEIAMLVLVGSQSSISPKTPLPNFEASVCSRFPNFRSLLTAENFLRYASPVGSRSGNMSFIIDRVTFESS